MCEVVATILSHSLYHTQDTEAGRLLSSRPVWATQLVPGQKGSHSQALSGKSRAAAGVGAFQEQVEGLGLPLRS